MKRYKPSGTFIILVCLAFSAFLVVVGHHEYKRLKTNKELTEQVLITHKKTEHFYIYSDLGLRAVDYYEQFFEGFYEYFDREYFPIRQRRRLKIFLFSGTDSYMPYAQSVGAKTTSGFYKGPWENIIVVNRDSGLGTATHELVHHFIATSFKRRPVKWVDEGIATFFEKFIGHLNSDGELDISFGYFSNWRFPITKGSANGLSLSRMIKEKEPEQCAVRSLMLFLHKKGVFKDFVRQISKTRWDRDGSATLQRVYGKSIDQIEKEWVEWVKSQPIDEDVALVSSAFVLTESEWQRWWQINQNRLYWSDSEQIYRVRK